jgi:ABC-type sulfate/molybdate transport systems ATPase subunit
MRPAGDGRIRVDSWNCTLQTNGASPPGAAFVGIRAHHIQLAATGENTFPFRVVDVVESPFEITVFIRIESGESATHPGVHLEAELPADEWRAIQQLPQPWHIRLPPERLLLLLG